jgi:hypothetical protein
VTSCLLFDVPVKEVDIQLLESCIVEELLCERFDGLDVSEEFESNGSETVMETSEEGLDNEF